MTLKQPTKFVDLINRFAVWKLSPLPSCVVAGGPEETLDLLQHDDFGAISVPSTELVAHLNNPENWTKDQDGEILAWSIQLGFSSLWVIKINQTPSLYFPEGEICIWCGHRHHGGPENCKND